MPMDFSLFLCLFHVLFFFFFLFLFFSCPCHILSLLVRSHTCPHNHWSLHHGYPVGSNPCNFLSPCHLCVWVVPTPYDTTRRRARPCVTGATRRQHRRSEQYGERSVLNHGRFPETRNQRLTVPPTSHRRPVFFNPTHRQFVSIQSRVLSFHGENDTQPMISQPFAQVLSPEPARAVKSGNCQGSKIPLSNRKPAHSGGEMGVSLPYLPSVLRRKKNSAKEPYNLAVFHFIPVVRTRRRSWDVRKSRTKTHV